VPVSKVIGRQITAGEIKQAILEKDRCVTPDKTGDSAVVFKLP
jgi:hypothetical protein